MSNKIIIFDSHPVQYKAPVYQALERLAPGDFEVIYATDVSVRKGNIDREFGKEVAWDTPLLTGYQYQVLNNERGVPLSTPSSLSGRGVMALLRARKPAAIVLTQARYWFDHTAYLSALLLGIPVLIRQETQDDMFAGQRSWLKQGLRSLIYRVLYAPVKHAFAFGELNYQHLTRHGIDPDRITFAHFSVPNPIALMAPTERMAARQQIRKQLGVHDDQIVLGFFGKLIPKKNPELLFECLQYVPKSLLQRLHIMVVGSGELQGRLDQLAADALNQYGVRTSFMGFVNQSMLPPHYLAADIVGLPSRRMGEAWGLVINEALQAGCGVIMSNAVGSVTEFGHLERVEVVGVEDARAFGEAIFKLARFTREVDWAASYMAQYSSEAAALALHQAFAKYLNQASK